MKEIRLEVNRGENFTPASLMNRYAKQTHGVDFFRSYYGNARLKIESKTYEYQHWGVTAKNGKTIVSLFLQEVRA